MKKQTNKIRFKIPVELHTLMLDDLKRKHAFAFERVGFLHTISKKLEDNTILIIAKSYEPVADDDYIEDSSVGAKINSSAIRKAMQFIFEKKGGCFHVHLHEHKCSPSPSLTDQNGLPKVAESFSNIAPNQANGILILSEDSFYCSVKIGMEKRFTSPELISVIGYPMRFVYTTQKDTGKNKIFERQSFLGDKSQFLFRKVKVGIIGYGGGGSHIGQQLAHIGVENIYVFDNDIIEDTNLNRLVGGWFEDIKKGLLKTSIAKRIIKKILPSSNVKVINTRWQESPEFLQLCDIVIGCVDSYLERQQLEAECRRYLIPYIDIGMDVYKAENGDFSLSGQVILSMSGMPCMTCIGFLTEAKLAQEAAKYGNVGGKPQVIWPNGVLASTAVGIFVDLVTGWAKEKNKLVYLAYNGNTGTMSDHIRLKYCEKKCIHYPFDQTGPPIFVKFRL